MAHTPRLADSEPRESKPARQFPPVNAPEAGSSSETQQDFASYAATPGPVAIVLGLGLEDHPFTR